MKDISFRKPVELRMRARRGEWTGLTAGLLGGYVQAGVAIMPKSIAYDFLLYCQRNPRPFPLMEVTDEGCREAVKTAPGSDLCTDLPGYRVYRDGEMVDETTSIEKYWRDDFISFIFGCSFSFEEEMLKAGVPVRNIEQGINAPIFVTKLKTVPAGIFQGSLAVTMRPVPSGMVTRTIQVTSRFPSFHGAPIHVGSPENLGIYDFSKPDYADTVAFEPGDVPVFWACSVTLQAIMPVCRPEILITQSPGHMFVTDLKNEILAAY